MYKSIYGSCRIHIYKIGISISILQDPYVLVWRVFKDLAGSICINKLQYMDPAGSICIVDFQYMDPAGSICINQYMDPAESLYI